MCAFQRHMSPSEMEFLGEFMVRVHILIIDENVTHQRLAVLMAQRFGYEATVVTEVDEAVDKLSSDTTIQVVLLDLEIPRSAKSVRCIRELTRLRRVLRGRFAVVANSAHALPEDVDECLRLGADDSLTKPYTSEQFHDVVQKWTSPEEQVRLAS